MWVVRLMPVFVYKKIGSKIRSTGKFSFAVQSGGGTAVLPKGSTYEFTNDGPSAYVIVADNDAEMAKYFFTHPELKFCVQGEEPEDGFDTMLEMDDNGASMEGITISWRWLENFQPEISLKHVNAASEAVKSIATTAAAGFGLPGSGDAVGASESAADAASYASDRVKRSLIGRKPVGRVRAMELNIINEGRNTGKQALSAQHLAVLVKPERYKRVKRRK